MVDLTLNWTDINFLAFLQLFLTVKGLDIF